MQTVPGITKSLQWLHELLFSMNLAILTVWVNTVTARSSWAVILKSTILSYRYPNRPAGTDDYFEVQEAFFLLVVALAMVLFLVFRISAGSAVTRALLRVLAGFVAVGGFPLAVLYIGQSYSGFSRAMVSVLFLELLGASICVFLFEWGKWSVPTVFTVLFVAVHFGVWALATWGSYEFIPFYSLIGFFASLAWGIYVAWTRMSGEQGYSDRRSSHSA